MKTRLSFLSILLVAALCLVACGTNTDPETETPNEQQTDPETETPKKEELTVTPLQINAPAEGGEYTLEIESEIKCQVSSNAGWVTCNPGLGKNNGSIKVTVSKSEVAEVTNATITVSGYGSGATDNKVLVSVTRAAGSVKPEEPEPEVIPEGALSGIFPVSESVKVRFSKGNLQYQASTDTWRFAENQYDMIGDNNENISATYSGWIDLFGWGTGSNPIVATTEDSDYSTFTNWGTNKISNGGNTANQWSTLTHAQWDYVITKGSKMQKLVSVAGIYGYLLLPLDFVTPSGADLSSNSFSSSEWSGLQANGAVFFPAAGSRYGTSVTKVGERGHYWTSNDWGEEHAWGLLIKSNEAYQGNYHRFEGLSVRLVQFCN